MILILDLDDIIFSTQSISRQTVEPAVQILRTYYNIDDLRDCSRIFKKGIFEKIVEREKIATEKVWVIGDNPESELIVGNSLGMNTIQRLGRYPEKSPYVDYGMNSFEELNDILKWH